jgi:hypothetical protein
VGVLLDEKLKYPAHIQASVRVGAHRAINSGGVSGDPKARRIGDDSADLSDRCSRQRRVGFQWCDGSERRIGFGGTGGAVAFATMMHQAVSLFESLGLGHVMLLEPVGDVSQALEELVDSLIR